MYPTSECILTRVPHPQLRASDGSYYNSRVMHEVIPVHQFKLDNHMLQQHYSRQYGYA